MLEKIRDRAGALPRRHKRAILIAFDAAALLFVLWLSYALRFNRFFVPSQEQFLLFLAAPAIAVPIFVRLGLYRAVIRYLPERALWTVVHAMTIAAIGWVFLVFLTEMAGTAAVPRSVPILYWLFGIFTIGASRFIAKRLLIPYSTSGAGRGHILIYGAGAAGSQLASMLRGQRHSMVAGFLDDNPALHGRDVAGVRVFDPEAIQWLINQYGIREVILSMPSLNTARRREIFSALSRYPVRIRTLPPISDLVAGKYLVNQIREIDIDELLGRSSVPADIALLERMITGKTIMVTGAGGSIGTELCRLVARWTPACLVLFEANEYALYRIDGELRRRGVPVVPVLGSVGDAAAVRRALAGRKVDVIFHAAAHKHVPMVEVNALEGIRNNVFGTLNLVERAIEADVGKFVLISSDKAVRPTNVMGATKRWAELILRHFALERCANGGGTVLSSVRFGNVLGSNGSVVPAFKEQIAAGGPVTLTDPRMTRYFMSIHEAVELIVQAGALAEGGDVFLLEMGKPVLIRDLAENMIQLAGFSVRDADHPHGDIEIVVEGTRPGEKLFEELFYDASTAMPTAHPKIMRARRSSMEAYDVPEGLARLRAAFEAGDEKRARQVLFDLIRKGEEARNLRIAGA